MLIVCGARCTEPQYLAGLRDSLSSRAVDIRITQHAKDPAQVVAYAARYVERSTKDFDEVWCVVDVDEYDLEPVAQKARRAGIRLAVSNPCFELWLLLHHEECRSQLKPCAAVQRRLRKHVPGYDKVRLDFGCFVDGVAAAVRRAKALDPSGGRHELNPSTSVWRLVEKMTG